MKFRHFTINISEAIIKEIDQIVEAHYAANTSEYIRQAITNQLRADKAYLFKAIAPMLQMHEVLSLQREGKSDLVVCETLSGSE